ncbi:hypothetical protein ACU4GD_36430 [Cupriavidus basilensis]
MVITTIVMFILMLVLNESVVPQPGIRARHQLGLSARWHAALVHAAVREAGAIGLLLVSWLV